MYMIYDDILHFWSPKIAPVVCNVTNKQSAALENVKTHCCAALKARKK